MALPLHRAVVSGATLDGVDVDSLENFERAYWDAPETEAGDIYNEPQEWDE